MIFKWWQNIWWNHIGINYLECLRYIFPAKKYRSASICSIRYNLMNFKRARKYVNTNGLAIKICFRRHCLYILVHLKLRKTNVFKNIALFQEEGKKTRISSSLRTIYCVLCLRVLCKYRAVLGSHV